MIEVVVNPLDIPLVAWGVGAVVAWRVSLRRIETWSASDPLALCDPCRADRRIALDHLQEHEWAAERFACLAAHALTWFWRTSVHRALYGRCSGDGCIAREHSARS